MTSEQIANPQQARRRAYSLCAAVLATIGGVFALVSPFASSAPPWVWRLAAVENLEGASVNADLVSIDEHGAVVAPQGERAVSLITPPLELAASANRVLVIRAALPGLPPGESRAATINLLWQTEPVPQFRFVPHQVALSAEPAEIRISLPAAPSKIHRLGVQFPGVRGRVLVSSLELPDMPFGERIALAWREFNEAEPLKNYSVNFLRGPTILGLSLNYYMLAAMFAVGGFFAFARLLRRRSVPLRAMLLIVFVAWLPADVLATRNLWQQATIEREALCGMPRTEQIATIYGNRLAWAYEEVLRLTPEGVEYAVISDDVFTPAHRLDYLLAPTRTRKMLGDWMPGSDDASTNAQPRERYAVVIECDSAQYDDAHRTIHWRAVEDGGVERSFSECKLLSRNNFGDMILRFEGQ